MGDKTRIEWTRSDDGSPGATWNPVTGCTKVSAGCDHCYAETLAERFRGTPGHYFEGGFDVQLRPEKLDQPLRWQRPRRIFVNSMSDLFHDQVPDEYIARVFAVMTLAPQHTFQILTKRHGRMRSLLGQTVFQSAVDREVNAMLDDGIRWPEEWDPEGERPDWPLPNVWLGVSAEDQQWANIRIPALLATPAAVRFVSAEPLLGPIDLSDIVDRWRDDDPEECDWGHCDRAAVAMRRDFDHQDRSYVCMLPVCEQHRGIDWVIVGGESGRGARPMHPDWVRQIRDWSVGVAIPFMFKQRGEWSWSEPGVFHMPTPPLTDRVAVMHPAGMVALTKSNPFDPFAAGHPDWATRIERVGKRAAGRELDGRTWDEFPGN